MRSARAQDDLCDLGDRPRAAFAAQQLLQYIRRRGLSAGDRLPPQSQLRGELKFSNDSLSAAMSVLVRRGVLVRKPRQGTFVVDPNRTIPGVWRVGIAALPAVQTQAYYGQLLLALHVHLSPLGSTTTYILKDQIGVSEPPLDAFGSLTDDLAAGRIHGALLMTGVRSKEWAYWNKRGVPLLHVGSWEDAPGGVVIDQAPMVREAVRLLCARGIRRIGVVSSDAPQPGYKRYWDSFCEARRDAGLPVAEVGRDCFFGGEGAIGGARVAARLLAMPAHQRPLGLVVVDDRVAIGLAGALAEQVEYRPVIVVQTNLQAPGSFAVPVIHIELDVDDLARAAMSEMLERLVEPTLPSRVCWVAPRLRDAREVRFVSQSADDAAAAIA